jgi:hypothetical protein
MQKLELKDLDSWFRIVTSKKGCTVRINGKIIMYADTAENIRKDFTLCRAAAAVAKDKAWEAKKATKAKAIILIESAQSLYNLIQRNRIFHEQIQN